MQNWNTTNNNVAINGYDVVSCFSGCPTVGVSEWTCDHAGCTWQFCSEENKNKFESNPGNFVPEFGGFCAWGVSEGKTCTVDPNCCIVDDCNLYLFCDNNAKSQWEKNCNTCCSTAQSNWSKGQLIAA